MTWKFQNSHALLQCGAITGQVNVAQPHLGLHKLCLDSSPLAGRVCSVEREASSIASTSRWPAELVDAYVRGNDLIASYQATDEWPFSPQVYWCADSFPPIDDVLGSLSLQISVSTQLLDTHPKICAVTELAAEEIIHLTATEDAAQTKSLSNPEQITPQPERDTHCLLWRLPGRVSYVEIVPARDFYVVTFRHHDDRTCEARWGLIAEFLEKGVIRRTRLQAAFLPRERDLELATQCARAFAARPLPLTT